MNRFRRRTLKALGALAGVSVVGSGTALGTQLDERVDNGRLTAVQAEQLLRQAKRLTAGDAAPGDWFGIAVSVSDDGSTALVWAQGYSEASLGSGAAYVYDLTQDPSAETKLTASDAAGDEFGSSVTVDADGTTALVGACLDDDAGNWAGSAYVYTLEESSKPIISKRAFQFDLAVGEVIEDIGESEDAYYGRQGRLIRAMTMTTDGSVTGHHVAQASSYAAATGGCDLTTRSWTTIARRVRRVRHSSSATMPTARRSR